MRIVVTLSTIPSRVQYLGRILDCLHRQTYPIDCIYLHLPYYSRREKCMYPDLPTDLNLSKVEVVRCPDHGPLTKLYPVLNQELDPETIIITVDDDINYVDDRIESLVRYCQLCPYASIGGGGIIVGSWWNGYTIVTNPSEVTPVDIISGYSACAYRRKFFDHTLIDFKDAPPETFYVDDVWISGYLASKGIVRLVHPESHENISVSELPDGLHKDTCNCYARFFIVSNYFKQKGVFTSQTSNCLRHPSVGIGLIVFVILVIVLIVMGYWEFFNY